MRFDEVTADQVEVGSFWYLYRVDDRFYVGRAVLFLGRILLTGYGASRIQLWEADVIIQISE